jgi:Arc/MetJ-type ribon-helix-helix transcriptional regulator
MRRNRTITAMVSEREVEVIDRLVENGYYCSRSDAVRAFVRYCIVRTERDGVIFE